MEIGLKTKWYRLQTKTNTSADFSVYTQKSKHRILLPSSAIAITIACGSRTHQLTQRLLLAQEAPIKHRVKRDRRSGIPIQNRRRAEEGVVAVSTGRLVNGLPLDPDAIDAAMVQKERRVRGACEEIPHGVADDVVAYGVKTGVEVGQVAQPILELRDVGCGYCVLVPLVGQVLGFVIVEVAADTPWVIGGPVRWKTGKCLVELERAQVGCRVDKGPGHHAASAVGFRHADVGAVREDAYEGAVVVIAWIAVAA